MQKIGRATRGGAGWLVPTWLREIDSEFLTERHFEMNEIHQRLFFNCLHLIFIVIDY